MARDSLQIPSYEEEKLLRDESGVQRSSCHSPRCRQHSRIVGTLYAVVFCLAATCLGLLATLLRTCSVHKCDDPTLAVFSPAHSHVEYETRRFNRSRGDDKSAFQGWPSDEIDSNWNRAIVPGIFSSISEEMAAKLPDSTARLPVAGRENEYIVTLDVFHQMHCLNVVRMALYKHRYDKHFYHPNGTVDHCKWLHVDHCLDQVRQALMCSGDTSVVHYSWSETVHGMRPRVDNLHTCRKYDLLLEWAEERALGVGEWHPSKHVVEVDGQLVIETGANHASGLDMGECNAI